MIGFKQLVGCCSPSTTPINGPAFPGQGKLNFKGQGSVNFNLDVSKFYKFGTASTLCDSYNVLLYDGTYGESISASANIDQTSSAMTASDQGSYSIGLRWKKYTGSMTVVDKYIKLDFTSTVTLFSKEQLTGGSHYSTIHCDDPFTSTAAGTALRGTNDTNYGISYNFTWLGVAQRDLPGIRLKRISGSDVWLVSVNNGMVSVYTEDGTKSFATSGTLQQVAANINASSISTWISARCSGWDSGVYTGGGGETNGDVGTGLNEWHYVFTKNDPSTILKNLAPTYINVYCNDTYAPVLWATSTRLPVFVRGDSLPPRGVVSMRIPDSADIGFNTLYPAYPMLKQYDNTDEGALLFLTDPIYLIPQNAWGADVSWDVIDDVLVVDDSTGVAIPGYTFGDMWDGVTSYSSYTRNSYGSINFDKVISYNYTPLSLSIYNEQFYGSINGCQSDSESCPCYNPVYNDCFNQLVNSASPACVFGGCDFGACPVYCFQSPCFYTSYGDCLFPPATPYPSCVTTSDCVLKYSYYVLGSTIATTPPTSGTYTASVSTSVRFV